MTKKDSMNELTPQQIVAALDKHIVGQDAAKRAVAIALRNRWRRAQLGSAMQREVTPKNILMIGPTGVGKTEIARRLARLANAPFIKVEATKFTEVGYVGRDVESIIRDLTETAVANARAEAIEQARPAAADAAEERLLDALLPGSRDQESSSSTRQTFRKRLREGDLDEREIDIEVASGPANVELFTPPGLEEMSSQLKGLFENLGTQQSRRRRMTVAAARAQILEEEAARLVNDEDLKSAAVERVQNHGIVFIDEIDKVAARGETQGADVSREGVQRDLLPLVEGSAVSTKHGVVHTDHILFIASGAFHLSKPSDLIPELQGRLPIRVELDSLAVQDFERILTEPDCCLTEQYSALLATEGVKIVFEDTAIRRLAEIAYEVNEQHENIGARRLATVMERVLEGVSFTASEMTGQTVTLDADYVDQYLGSLASNQDLTQYIL